MLQPLSHSEEEELAKSLKYESKSLKEASGEVFSKVVMRCKVGVGRQVVY